MPECFGRLTLGKEIIRGQGRTPDKFAPLILSASYAAIGAGGVLQHRNPWRQRKAAHLDLGREHPNESRA